MQCCPNFHKLSNLISSKKSHINDWKRNLNDWWVCWSECSLQGTAEEKLLDRNCSKAFNAALIQQEKKRLNHATMETYVGSRRSNGGLLAHLPVQTDRHDVWNITLWPWRRRVKEAKKEMWRLIDGSLSRGNGGHLDMCDNIIDVQLVIL